MTSKWNRREAIAGATAAAVSAQSRQPADAALVPVPFGAAANHYALRTDAAYRDALARHCDVLVAESAMKWEILRVDRTTFDFTHGDALITFAASHGKRVRGHTLVWNEANPKWVSTLATAREAETELRRHIARVVGHYHRSIDSWDVVNEPIAEAPRNSMDLRPGIWTSLLGERYIDLAFRLAHEAAPEQHRVLNEYGIEHATPRDRLKRAAFKRLVWDLRDRGVPITAVGLQGHLDGAGEIDSEGLSTFCRDMTRAGLDVLVTELDVNDSRLPADEAIRDRIVAEKAQQFLAAVFAGCRPKVVCCWGLSDRYTWVPTYFKRADGLKNRPLPLDANFAVKPLMSVVAAALKGA